MGLMTWIKSRWGSLRSGAPGARIAFDEGPWGAVHPVMWDGRSAMGGIFSGSIFVLIGTVGIGKSQLIPGAGGGGLSAGFRPSAFRLRALAPWSVSEWEIGADEAVDERHPLFERAFSNACERASEAQLEALADEIAKRLAGEASIAPSLEWLDGFFEPDGQAPWEALRVLARPRLAARLEALALGEACGAALPSGRGARAL